MKKDDGEIDDVDRLIYYYNHEDDPLDIGDYVFLASIIIIYIIIGGWDFALWVAELVNFSSDDYSLWRQLTSDWATIFEIKFYFILFVGVFFPMGLIFVGLVLLDDFLEQYTGLILFDFLRPDIPEKEKKRYERIMKEPPVLQPIRTPAVQTAPSVEGGSISGGTITVTVPAGFQPGQQIQIKAPDGRLFLVTIPVGMQPGSQFQVNIA